MNFHPAPLRECNNIPFPRRVSSREFAAHDVKQPTHTSLTSPRWGRGRLASGVSKSGEGD
jgi:hypothetical protein